jgi:hypothetical protein
MKAHGGTVIVAFCLFFSAIFHAGAEDAERTPLGVKPMLHNPKSMLVGSGVAYDASENILGIISIKEPRSFFKPDTDQVTWWGEFKPFKFWGRPELEARWYTPSNPDHPHSVQQFKGEECALAKSTLKMSGPVAEGKWRVDIYHKGEKIDSKNFIIYGPPRPALPELKIQSKPKSDKVALVMDPRRER